MNKKTADLFFEVIKNLPLEGSKKYKELWGEVEDRNDDSACYETGNHFRNSEEYKQ